VCAEEDKGHFAHSPLPFAVFLKIIKKIGLKPFVLIVLGYF
jgi:hypothetical protein